ncbi:hypothetical protein [Gemmata massiliana]|uniref:hypothetical protein n=1 Tax=Gemmata massiliana TaxID=1210884 RepID=UPI0013A6C82B|nr:hypothetical protein [Gemmata massiliana]
MAATTDLDDGDDGEVIDDGGDLDLNAPVISPPRSFAGEGLPDLEIVPGVQSARAAEAGIAEKRKVLAEAKATLLTELKLPASATERDLDKRQVALIVAGADETEIEKLRATYKREQLLTQAANEAAGATRKALDQARNALAEEAEAKLYVPALRDAATKYLEFLVAGQRVLEISEQLGRAGMRRYATSFAAGEVPCDRRDIGAIWQIAADLVRRGALTAEEIEAALPGAMPG